MKMLFWTRLSFLPLFFGLLLLCRSKETSLHKISLSPLEKSISGQKSKADPEPKPRWLYLPHSAKVLSKEERNRELEKRAPELRLVTQLLSALFFALSQRKAEEIGKFVHPKEGLYVDLKAHWSYERLLKEIASQSGYLYEVLLSKKDPLSVYRSLRAQSQIEVDYYPREGMYELKLDLGDSSDASYHFNNPVFIHRMKKWYLYRLP